MFKLVGFPSVSGEWEAHGLEGRNIRIDVKGDINWLSLEELYQLKEVVEHLIVLASAEEIKGP